MKRADFSDGRAVRPRAGGPGPTRKCCGRGPSASDAVGGRSAFFVRLALRLCGAALFAGWASTAAAQQSSSVFEPGRREALEDVGVDELLGAGVPKGLEFVDETGRKVRIDDYFDLGRPVLLTMNYSNCPMLCSMQLNSLFGCLKQLKASAGADFEVVSVSFDPEEASARGAEVKARYGTIYARPEAQAGIHFLTGGDATIRRLAAGLGIRYKYLPDTNEYSHAAVVLICSPTGKICRYVHGVQFDVDSMATWIGDARDGTIGESMAQFLTFCYGMAGAKSGWQFAAVMLKYLGGLATMGGLGYFVYRLRKAELAKASTSGGPLPKGGPLPDGN